jgi:hypothetical protein
MRRRISGCYTLTEQVAVEPNTVKPNKKKGGRTQRQVLTLQELVGYLHRGEEGYEVFIDIIMIQIDKK